MNILQIANDYRSANLYENLFVALNKRGINQMVYVPFKEKLEINEIEDFSVVSSNCYTNFDRFFFEMKTNKIFNDLIEKNLLNNIDVVHAHTLFSNGYVAYKAYLEYKVPYVVTIRGTDTEVFLKKRPWLKTIGRRIIRNAKYVIFLSEVLKSNTEKLLGESIDPVKSKVIPNGLGEFWFENINRKNNSPEIAPEETVINLIQVGWINKNKNQLTTIKAVKLLKDLGYSVNLKLIGGTLKKDLKYERVLKKYITQHGLLKEINFLGKLNKEEIICNLRESHIFILPSFQETFGISYLEALSQNLPLIYTRNQGIDGTFYLTEVGISVNPKLPQDISRGIISIVENYDKYNYNYAQLKRFSWDSIAEEIFEIYTNVEGDF